MVDAVATDRFAIYYSEKLWQLIPEVYRFEDGLGDHPGVLRALVETIGQQAATLRRSNDRLWDDAFIDLCDDWAISYIGDLVGTRLLSSLNARGRRIDVAKTIYYRRRKGTLLVLEELTRDITGWEGHVVEGFKRLARAHHALDPRPQDRLGRVTRTLPGGFPDLRHPRGAQLADGTFDEFHHMPDVRQNRGGIDGRHGITKLAVHLHRLDAVMLTNVVPHPIASVAATAGFTFDPSGRDAPLFMRRRRGSEWRPALEWDLPAPMPCRVLGDAHYLVSRALAAANPGVVPDDLVETSIRSEQRVDDLLTSSTKPSAVAQFIRANAIVDDCGKAALYPSDAPLTARTEPYALEIFDDGSQVRRELVTAGHLEPMETTTPDSRVVIDSVRGRLLFVERLSTPLPAPDAVRVAYHYGFSGPVGAGGQPRALLGSPAPTVTCAHGGILPSFGPTDVVEIEDSSTYDLDVGPASSTKLIVRAADRQRPYVRIGDKGWTLVGTGDASLEIDGVWLGNASGTSTGITLDGDFGRVHLRRVTLDPGGTDAEGNPISAVTLIVIGSVKELVIEDSIVGPIVRSGAGLIETLTITRSIVQALTAPKAIDVDTGITRLSAVTVFGDVLVHRAESSEALIAGVMSTINAQDGCFRFGAAGATSTLPHPYESFVSDDLEGAFHSRLFGHPGYAQLGASAPIQLRRGGENGLEMGAFRDLYTPLKLDDLQKKVEEYMPFGLIPIFLLET
ncbi:hypothetical protein BH09MYX1_BH09MYX1_28280 [soil metagenome]